MQAFFGTSLEDAVTLDGVTQLGTRKDIGPADILQGGLLFSSVPTQVWEDPYAEGVRRKETDRDSTGVRLQWDPCDAACQDLLRSATCSWARVTAWRATSPYGSSSLDARNPIFGARTDTDGIVVNSTLFYRLPFESGRWQAIGNVLWGEGNSDVAFHDNEIFMISAGVMYRFGTR